jgi:hypothetical protein
MEHSSACLESARKLFLYYKTLGERTIAQLDDAALHWQYNEESNSIAVIIKHLWGNMLSRWTDFLTSDGEKSWRKRDEEFENEHLDHVELLARWEAGWACLFDALDSLAPEDLDQIVYIRNEGHTVMEAINRQIAHYAYHVGQIVFIGKMVKNQDWQTLSIARNRSDAFNAEKFGRR